VTPHSSIPVRRLELNLGPDPSRVILRPFIPSADPRELQPNPSRLLRIAERVLALSSTDAATQLGAILDGFVGRHPELPRALAERFTQVCGMLPGLEARAQQEHRLLIGAYFTHEYSFEAAALFNPSIVPHPDQTGLAEGELRFVLSLRATGEGHVSSITFRSGIVDAQQRIRIDPVAGYAVTAAVQGQRRGEDDFDISFPAESSLCSRVIFPITPRQRNGLEDARFVRFVEHDGTASYYATYTAYSGRDIAPEVLRTDDFRQYRFLPVRGDAVRNKGMALFPRRIGGRYAMLARLDGETLQLVLSDNLCCWSSATPILAPLVPWEFVQIGNCGSPIELPEGWLVLTHGVGAMRRYCLGAALLDLSDPTKVLGRLCTPLLQPDELERNGYVPNVLYTCGALAHGANLILPFAASDWTTRFAVVPLSDLLAAVS